MIFLWIILGVFVVCSFIAAFDGTGNTLAKVIAAVSVVAIPAYILMSF